MNYGWVRSLPDYRDFKLKITAPVALPEVVDLRPLCPPVYDQGQLGSCSGNAIAGAIEFGLLKEAKADFVPSRLFIYFNERLMEGTVDQDAGAQIRDGIKTIRDAGVCDEKIWPYDISKFKHKPPNEAYDAAKCDLITNYQMIGDGNLSLMKQTLAAGLPFIFGFTVFDGLESLSVASTGVLNMPTPNESVLGGHATICVGYHEADQRFIIRNSWGEKWGVKGYFTMPYEYMRTMASDIWVINSI